MLKDKVKDLMQRHNSGAIFLRLNTPTGSISLEFDRVKAFLDKYFPELAFSKYPGSHGIDFWISHRGYLHPLTEKGWDALETLYQNPIESYEIKLNTQDASFSDENFAGLIDVEFDQNRIRRDQKQNEEDRVFAGYGKSRMGGWVETS